MMARPNFLPEMGIRCPSANCKCIDLMTSREVKYHLYRNGLESNYFFAANQREDEANQRVVEVDKRTKELHSQFLIDMEEFRKRMTVLENHLGGGSYSTSRPYPHYNGGLDDLSEDDDLNDQSEDGLA